MRLEGPFRAPKTIENHRTPWKFIEKPWKTHEKRLKIIENHRKRWYFAGFGPSAGAKLLDVASSSGVELTEHEVLTLSRAFGAYVWCLEAAQIEVEKLLEARISAVFGRFSSFFGRVWVPRSRFE